MTKIELWHQIQRLSPSYAKRLKHDKQEQKIIGDIFSTFGINSIEFVPYAESDFNCDNGIDDDSRIHPDKPVSGRR